MATDFRSDTVTRPTAAMRAAMAEAPVGDDVFGDDPSVNALEAEVAEMLGFEAAMYVPSGTQSNLVGVMTHCARGDEYIVGQDAHTYRYEAGGAAVLGSIQPQPLDNAADGTIPLPAIEAAVKQRVDPRAIAEHFDSVSVCLSKGLGAPVGSVLCGKREFIKTARRWRKMVGGGMRQAGILAAAGRHALKHHIERLAEDHENAARLAAGLARHKELTVAPTQTNMVFVTVRADIADAFAQHLAAAGVRPYGTTRQRWCTHLDVSRGDIDAAIACVDRFFAQRT